MLHCHPDSIADLEAADAFEPSFDALATAPGARIREGMFLVRTLDGVVKNKYANNPVKLAAWTSASHVEKAPKKVTPTPPGQ